MVRVRNEGRHWVTLTFSRELKGDDGVALFEGSWLSIGCLDVNVDGVKDVFCSSIARLTRSELGL